MKWAARLRGGTVCLSGTLACAVGPIPAGPAVVVFDFVGGHEPRIARMRIGDREVPVQHAVDTLVAVVDALHDATIDATATPDGDLLVRLALGVEVVIPASTKLRVHGAAVGSPSEPVLDRSLVLEFDGDGLKLSHEVRWVARLAQIRLGRAALHPDGAVALEARASSRTGDLALKMPLHRAASHLTDLVRRSPKVRSFLRKK